MVDDLLWRLPILALFLAAGVIYDRWRHGPEGRRAKEYSLLLACGLVGALVGLLQDLISIRVSPDYFVLGKGIEPGADFTRQVLLLGTYAGMVAGLVLGGLLLLANQPRASRAPHADLDLARRGIPRTLGPALVGSPIGFGVGPSSPLRELLGPTLLGPEATDRFLQVWGMHICLYAGALLGVVWALVHVWRSRPRQRESRLADEASPPSEGSQSNSERAQPLS